MKLVQGIGRHKRPLWKRALIVSLVAGTGVSVAQTNENAANTHIWDTLSPFANTLDIENKSGWRHVPTDLLTLELNPSTISADPGYYGREYAFEGDAIVENKHYTAVFHAQKGRVILYSKANANKKRIELVPLQLKDRPARIAGCTILQNTGDEATLEVTFPAGRTEEGLSAVIAFDTSEIVEVRPAEKMKGVSLLSPIEKALILGHAFQSIEVRRGQRRKQRHRQRDRQSDQPPISL